MLRATYQRCWQEVSDDCEDEKKILNNALIESFCVHARNLIEFFQDKQSMSTYADPNYKAFRVFDSTKISKIYKKLCAQITHLVYQGQQDRTILVSQKIDARDRYEILNILRTEITTFKAHVVTSYTSIAATIPVPPRPFDISVSMGPNATRTTTNFSESSTSISPPRGG
jgi:hypothetical protein